jgi:hypothetical protein
MTKILDAQQGELPLHLAAHADSSSGTGFCTRSLDGVRNAVARRLTELVGQVGSATVACREDVRVHMSRPVSRDTVMWYAMLVRCGVDAAALVAAHMRCTGSLDMDWRRSASVQAFLYQGWDAVEAQYILQINMGGPVRLTGPPGAPHRRW